MDGGRGEGGRRVGSISDNWMVASFGGHDSLVANNYLLAKVDVVIKSSVEGRRRRRRKGREEG